MPIKTNEISNKKHDRFIYKKPSDFTFLSVKEILSESNINKKPIIVLNE